jgi:hypothetical protein
MYASNSSMQLDLVLRNSSSAYSVQKVVLASLVCTAVVHIVFT